MFLAGIRCVAVQTGLGGYEEFHQDVHIINDCRTETLEVSSTAL